MDYSLQFWRSFQKMVRVKRGYMNFTWFLLWACLSFWVTPHFYAYLLLLLGSCRQKASCDLEKEVKNLRLEFSDLHLKHKTLARELQRHQDIDAKNKAEIKRLRGNFILCYMIGHNLLKVWIIWPDLEWDLNVYCLWCWCFHSYISWSWVECGAASFSRQSKNVKTQSKFR